MELDLTFFAIAVPAVLWSGISKGGFGSGAAFASTPLLALILEPGDAIGLMLPLLMLMDVTALKPYWGKWDAPSAKVLLLGAIPGVILGGLLYRIANPDVFRFLIGAIAILFIGWQMVRKLGLYRPEAHQMSLRAGGIAGVFVGFTSFISHAGGPPAAVFLLARGLDKTGYQATSVIVFWAVNLMKFLPYLALGIFTWNTALADLTLIPVAILGVWLGVIAHNAIPERLYFAITYVFLALTGTKLIWDALT